MRIDASLLTMKSLAHKHENKISTIINAIDAMGDSWGRPSLKVFHEKIDLMGQIIGAKARVAVQSKDPCITFLLEDREAFVIKLPRRDGHPDKLGAKYQKSFEKLKRQGLSVNILIDDEKAEGFPVGLALLIHHFERKRLQEERGHNIREFICSVPALLLLAHDEDRLREDEGKKATPYENADCIITRAAARLEREREPESRTALMNMGVVRTANCLTNIGGCRGELTAKADLPEIVFQQISKMGNRPLSEVAGNRGLEHFDLATSGVYKCDIRGLVLKTNMHHTQKLIGVRVTAAQTKTQRRAA